MFRTVRQVLTQRSSWRTHMLNVMAVVLLLFVIPVETLWKLSILYSLTTLDDPPSRVLTVLASTFVLWRRQVTSLGLMLLDWAFTMSFRSGASFTEALMVMFPVTVETDVLPLRRYMTRAMLLHG